MQLDQQAGNANSSISSFLASTKETWNKVLEFTNLSSLRYNWKGFFVNPFASRAHFLTILASPLKVLGVATAGAFMLTAGAVLVGLAAAAISILAAITLTAVGLSVSASAIALTGLFVASVVGIFTKSISSGVHALNNWVGSFKKSSADDLSSTSKEPSPTKSPSNSAAMVARLEVSSPSQQQEREREDNNRQQPSQQQPSSLSPILSTDPSDSEHDSNASNDDDTPVASPSVMRT